MATCSACGADVTNLKFCSQCGVAVASVDTPAYRAGTSTCSRCGAQLRPGAIYCGECGQTLNSGGPAEQRYRVPEGPYGSNRPYQPYPGAPAQPGYQSPVGPVYYGGYMPAAVLCPSCHLELHPGVAHCPRCHLDLVHACSSDMYHHGVRDILRGFLFGDDHHHHDYHRDYRHNYHHGYHRDYRRHDCDDDD